MTNEHDKARDQKNAPGEPRDQKNAPGGQHANAPQGQEKKPEVDDMAKEQKKPTGDTKR